MTKTRHQHVIEATITCAMPFDPADMESAVIIQKQFQSMAHTLVGFRSVTTRMTKLPVVADPVPNDGLANAQALQPGVNILYGQENAAMPPIPPGLKR